VHGRQITFGLAATGQIDTCSELVGMAGFVAIQQGLRRYMKAGPLGLLAGLTGT
jgi:hypothetical protein